MHLCLQWTQSLSLISLLGWYVWTAIVVIEDVLEDVCIVGFVITFVVLHMDMFSVIEDVVVAALGLWLLWFLLPESCV